MQYIQTEMNFNLSQVHNNPESQKIFDDNKPTFSKQCTTILEALRRGERLTVRDCMLKYNIGDPRARFRDLIKSNVPVKSELLEGRFKVYYL